MTNAPLKALRAQTFSFKDDPFCVSPEEAISYESDGCVVMQDGQILDVGPAQDILARYSNLEVTHYPDHLIMAGFVDSHVHFPQTEIIASYGEQLLTWLNKYTFPAEMKFADEVYAQQGATFFLDECLRNGVTTSSVYCTVHAQSADALFAEAARRNMRITAGKVLMDRHAPEGLSDTAQSGYDNSKKLIEKWHNKGRGVYCITPRFAPTSTPEQLEAAGVLWKEYPDALMQTHVSENHNEIAWVKELFPDCPDYLGVYEKFGLMGAGANFGHGIHLVEREISLLKEAGAGISHCPTSNTFIGSGLFDMQGLRDCVDPITVGLATDVGGGSSFSMFDTMKAAYEIAQLRGYNFHPAKIYYLATLGSAHLLRMGDKVGNLAKGYEADLQVINLKSRPLITERMKHARDIWEVLFLQMILADDRAIKAVYVAGEKVYENA